MFSCVCLVCAIILGVVCTCLSPVTVCSNPVHSSHPHQGSGCTEDTTQLQPTALPHALNYILLLRTTAQSGNHLRVAPISGWHPTQGGTHLRVAPMSRWHPCQDSSHPRMGLISQSGTHLSGTHLRVAHISGWHQFWDGTH